MSGLARAIDILVGTLAGLLVYVVYDAGSRARGLVRRRGGGGSLPRGVLHPALRRLLDRARSAAAPQFGRIFVAWTFVFAFIDDGRLPRQDRRRNSRASGSPPGTSSGLVGLFAGSRLRSPAPSAAGPASGLLERRAVIVGGGKAAEELIRALEAEPDNDIRICGIFDDRKDERSPLGRRRLSQARHRRRAGRFRPRRAQSIC